MPLLPACLAVPATTVLLLILLAAASSSAAKFPCTGPTTCKSAMGYIVPNATTYRELISRFNTSTLQDLLDANNLTSRSSNAAVPAGTTVHIPFTCACAAGDGVGWSDWKPVYTVQQGDILDNISRYVFGGFVTYQEVADANSLPDADKISPKQNLWIPLPCSCDRVDGSHVTHFAYSVCGDENTFQIAAKFGVAESTLLRVNNIADGHSLTMGQILDVPLPAPRVPGGTSHAPLMIVGAFLLVLVIWFSVACFKYIDQGKTYVRRAGDSAKRFKYHELAVATDKFSKSRELGRGAFGVVYKGNLKDQDGQEHQVAVKKIMKSDGETDDFYAELKTIGETRHKNLVRLKGWCKRNRSNLINFMCWCRQKQSVELFLVYELVPNGNLDVHLNKKENVLPWATRHNIVKDIGSALRYLHHECNKCILHRDIKPGNILLDEQYNAKLADFGLSRIAHHKNDAVLTTAATYMLGDDSNTNGSAGKNFMKAQPPSGGHNISTWENCQSIVVLTRAFGTAAYMDPKCMADGIVSINRCSDVYSFGIVLLEIACTGKSRAQVWDLYKSNPENMAAAADARLSSDFDVAQMQQVAVLGLWCSFPDDDRRPSLLQAMEVLEHNAALPNLVEYERGIAGFKGNESTGNGVEGTSYLVNGGLLTHPGTPGTLRRHHKNWQRSRAILSYVKLAHASETDPAS